LITLIFEIGLKNLFKIRNLIINELQNINRIFTRFWTYTSKRNAYIQLYAPFF
jgi:hypothetical protein